MKKAEESSFSDTENNVTETRNIRLSACRWRKKGKLSDSLINVVTKIQEQRKSWERRKRNKKDARAKEKNQILKQFVEILKNKLKERVYFNMCSTPHMLQLCMQGFQGSCYHPIEAFWKFEYFKM